MKIKSIRFWRAELPLNKPYALSLGTLEHYDAFILRIEAGNRVGWGEICALPGYHYDSPEEIGKYLQGLEGTTFEELKDRICEDKKRGYFKTAPLEMALEDLQTDYSQFDFAEKNIPLIGVLPLNGSPEELVRKGCRDIKIKLGTDIKSEIAWLKELKKNPDIRRLRLRFDANQALDFDHALAFCDLIRDLPALYLEQPFGIDDWPLTQKLCASQPVPVMLDESIYNEDDVRKAKEAGARWVKFKLAKHGTRREMLQLIRLAQKLGLGIILGNGVATEISCWYEGLVWLESGGRVAGEMNGFCKLQTPLVRNAFRVRNFVWQMPERSALDEIQSSIYCGLRT